MVSSTFGSDAPRPFRQALSAQRSSIGSDVAGHSKRLSSSAQSPKQTGTRQRLIQFLPLLNSGRNADHSFLCCAQNEKELSNRNISTFPYFFTAWRLIKRTKYFTLPLSYLQFQAEWQESDDVNLSCLIFVLVHALVFSLLQYSNSGLGHLIVEFSRPHTLRNTHTHTQTHALWNSPGGGIGSSLRPLPT